LFFFFFFAFIKRTAQQMEAHRTQAECVERLLALPDVEEVRLFKSLVLDRVRVASASIELPKAVKRSQTVEQLCSAVMADGAAPEFLERCVREAEQLFSAQSGDAFCWPPPPPSRWNSPQPPPPSPLLGHVAVRGLMRACGEAMVGGVDARGVVGLIVQTIVPEPNERRAFLLSLMEEDVDGERWAGIPPSFPASAGRK
jgi:hypothetical protein